MVVEYLKNKFFKSEEAPATEENSVAKEAPVVDVDRLSQIEAYAGQQNQSNYDWAVFDGGKFAGGFGVTQLYETDYWTARARSVQLFTENHYAKGLIQRLITNEINTGLKPECSPDEGIIGVEADSLQDWTEDVENRFQVWGDSSDVCDWKRQKTFWELQADARLTALISGDVLCILRQDPVRKLPVVEIVDGKHVSNPNLTRLKLKKGNTLKHGVERDSDLRVVAYWVKQKSGEHKRILAYGPRTGRLNAWLVFGTTKMIDDVRGMPLLTVILQSLKEIDRYRDSSQRRAVVASLIAMFVKKSENKMGSIPISNGATRKDSVTVEDGDGDTREFGITQNHPGMVLEELQQGEEPVAFKNDAVDVNFANFEEALIQSIAWANEIPPEILKLAFSSNYSASQAALNEFRVYLNKVWFYFGETFCKPIYKEWLLSEVLNGRIKAPGYLKAYRNPLKYDVFGAWHVMSWYGVVKQSTDMVKTVKASTDLVEQGFSTRAKETRNINGTKFSKNARRLQKENELLAETMRPIAEFKQKYGQTPEEVADTANAMLAIKDEIEELKSKFEEIE